MISDFATHMSTIDNIFVLNGITTHCINNNEYLYCCFVDFTKALDYVERNILWYKLIKIGVRGQMLDIFKSMYNSVKSRVKNNNNISEAFSCNIGVRQGECLSPFLFAMYVNDLEQELETNGVNGIDLGMVKLMLLLYADDIVLFGKSPEELQKSLNILEEYCERWKLTVNTMKTKIVVFRKGGKLPENLHFTYKREHIEIVNNFCYLGIVFTSGGSSFETQKTLSGQAQKAIFILRKYLNNFTALSLTHIMDLFDKLITPILNYGSEVWGFYPAKSVETTHMSFCKRMLKVKLLNHINELHQILRTQQVNITYHRNRPVFHRNPSYGYRKRPGTNKLKRFCHICSRSGSHNTNECWYNGKSDRLSDRTPY